MNGRCEMNCIRGADPRGIAVFPNKIPSYERYRAINVDWDNVFSAEELFYQTFRGFIRLASKVGGLHYRHLGN